MTNPTSQADHVINAKLGGVNATARLLGHKHASTVQGWLKSGFIPGRHQKRLLDNARAAGKDLTESDFIFHLQSDNAPAASDPSGSDVDQGGGVSCAPQAA